MQNNKTFLFFLLLLLNTPFGFAQDTPILDGLSYRSVGPSRGGRVTAITGFPNQPFTFLMGSTGGGVWKTTDAGNTWYNLSDGQIEAGGIGAIEAAPSQPSTIYVGTGSACPRGNISQGIGLYKSTDGGENWKHSGLPEAGQIGKIIVHPKDPEHVYVAALGHIFGPNPERGIYESTDGGESWEKILFVSDSTGAIDLVINPENPRELYAAFWRAERKPHTLIDGGREGGIWKSTDGGENWEKLGGGLPTGLLGRIGLAISPANPDRIWAIIQAAKEEKGGLYRSDNGGKSWSRINRDHQLRQRGWYYSHLTAHPGDENTLYSCNVSFHKSIDGGKNFDTRIRVPHGDNHGLWINPNNPNIMIQCNDGGATVTLNGGKTWTEQLNQPTSEFYRVSVDYQFPYRLYAGQQDNTTISVPSRYVPGLTPTEHWYGVGGGESADVAVHPENPDIVWAGTYSGEITVMNRATGQRRQVTAYPHYTEGTRQQDLKYRWQWNFPIAISQHDPQVIYHTSNYVHKTTNDGQNWERISPDLTNKLAEQMDIPGGPIQHDATGVEVYSSIFAFEESPSDPRTLWAGSDDGKLSITRDGGENWTDITPGNMPEQGTVNKIELSTHQEGRALVAVYNYRFDDLRPFIFLTENYGKSWKLLTDGKNGIPADHFVRAVAEDPVREGLLYAGTEYGMYLSFDDGNQWQPFQLNLPHTPVTDMEVHENDLVISTQGRAFWIFDDLHILQQHDEQLTEALHLFEPEPAYRTNVGNYGAEFHFHLSEAPDDNAEVSLMIKDASGNTVRNYRSGADNGLNQIRVKSGMNTFSWDIRHDGPELVEDLVTMVLRNPSPGPRAVPGRYTAVLTIGEETATTNIDLKPDPRWTDVKQADYEAQLATASEIKDMITESHRRIKNLRAIREQLKTIKKYQEQADEKLTTLMEEAMPVLNEVEGMIIQNKAEASQDAINYPRVFSNHIGRLYGVVINDHHRPTAGALERLEDLKVEYQGIVSAYDQLLETEIAAIRDYLDQHEAKRLLLPARIE
ncbi:MAG TPA: hypothetical protein VJ953_04960 [Saprospiraceae bacterium]|nr:hypothetical protein [Saprospiraceae bacterium]